MFYFSGKVVHVGIKLLPTHDSYCGAHAHVFCCINFTSRPTKGLFGLHSASVIVSS